MYKMSLRPFLNQHNKWPKLKYLEFVLFVETVYGSLEAPEPHSPVCCIFPTQVDTLLALPPNLETCKLDVAMIHMCMDSGYVFPNKISPLSLPQVTLLSIRDYEDFERFINFRSCLTFPNAFLNLHCMKGGTDGVMLEIPKLSPVLSEKINALSLRINNGGKVELISYLPDFTNLSRIQLTLHTLPFEKNLIIPRLDTDGSLLEDESFFEVNEIYDFVSEYFQCARNQFTKSRLVQNQKKIIDDLILDKNYSYPKVKNFVEAFRRLLNDPLDYIRCLGQHDLGSISDDFFETLVTIGVYESIFKKISEMPSVKFLEIDISDNFYMSPYLQYLSQYHPSLEQILFSYSEDRNYQLEDFVQLNCFEYVTAASSSAITQFPLSQRDVEKFFYTLLPVVPYKFISELSVSISQNMELFNFGDDHYKEIAFIYRQGYLNAVIDVKRKRRFENTPYQQQFNPNHYTPFKNKKQQKPIKFIKDCILEPSFNGWI